MDDGSTDGTIVRIERDPSVRVLQLRRNAGQSAAMLAGMHAARGESIVLLDGDLAERSAGHSQGFLPRSSAAPISSAAIRVLRRDTLLKRLSSRIANFVRSRFVGDGVRDTGCTLKAMRRVCVQALVPFKGVHRFIPALIKNAGFSIVEIPVSHRPRQFGVSKYGLGNRALRATLDMFGVRWLQSRRLDLGFGECHEPNSSAKTLRSGVLSASVSPLSGGRSQK